MYLYQLIRMATFAIFIFQFKKKFGETFYPLWSSLFSEVMPRKIKGDAPKKSLWSPPPKFPAFLSLSPMHT